MSSANFFELKSIIHKAIKAVGETNETRNKSTRNDAPMVHEYFLCSEMQTIVKKRYDNIRNEIYNHNIGIIDNMIAGPGSEKVVFVNNLMVMAAKKASPRKQINKAKLRESMLKHGIEMDTIDEIIEEGTTEAKAAVSFIVLPA